MSQQSFSKLLIGSVLMVVGSAGALLFWQVGTGASSLPPTPPFSGPQLHYSTKGKGEMTIEGPGCCTGIVIPSTFEMEYEADSAGNVQISRLYSAIADMDLRFQISIFATSQVKMRCGTIRSETPITASVDATGGLSIASGAATLSGDSMELRHADGTCGGTNHQLSLTNNAPLTGLLDPVANRVVLNGFFTTTIEGNSYNITLQMNGEYANRPPNAVFGVEGTGLEAFSQGGCPAVLNGGNPPEYVVDANDPNGLKMFLRSHSNDVDGAWSGGDVHYDQWFHARDSEPLKFLAESRRVGPFNFEFGPIHHLSLKTTDRLGASATSNCDFRVVDRTPPTVTPPGSATVQPTVNGGTTPSTSDALRDFLDSATASDSVDTAPKALPPLFNGQEITPNTFVPLTNPGQWHTITFRFGDRFGNVGTSVSYLRVIKK
jgi:hypothetical protein